MGRVAESTSKKLWMSNFHAKEICGFVWPCRKIAVPLHLVLRSVQAIT